MLNFNGLSNTTNEDTYVGYAGKAGNIVMIIISILGIIINSIFSFDYLKNIISIKNRNNAGISAVEKILCMIAIVETFISVFWLINNLTTGNPPKSGSDEENKKCDIVAYFEIFLNFFDWLILSTSLYQIKIILLNPQEILESGKRVFKYIIGCLIISLASFGLSMAADMGGVSPMLTCFITYQDLGASYRYVLFWLVLLIPLFCFSFGGYQVALILKSNQYKNDKNNREFFIEYSYFVITYIISSILLILTYVIHYIIYRVNEDGLQNSWYKAFIALVTFLTCSTPLIVGVIRYYRTGLLKKLCRLCKRRRRNLIQENENEQEELIEINNSKDEGGRMFSFEKKILEKLIIKYFTAVSFALGKSKYVDEGGEAIERTEKSLIEERKEYRIDKDEILKDLDLSLNDDIKVLGEANIDIEVTEYNSTLFKKLRKLEGLDEDKIIAMFQPNTGTNQLIHQVDDTLFINSSNKLLMLKEVRREQIFYFQNNILPNLYDYFVNHPNSIICRVFGLYRIKIDKGEDKYMALIYNIHESIELDHSNNDNIRQMKLSENELKSNILIDTRTADLTMRNASISFIKNNLDATVVQDTKKKTSFKLSLTEYENEKLDKIIQSDYEFLSSKSITGYHYIIFERKFKGNINMNLLSFSDESLNVEKKGNETGTKIMNEIKKYIFNANKANTIYCICINSI